MRRYLEQKRKSSKIKGQMNMNNLCKCESKPTKLCCPRDKELRKNWLSNLEKEHKDLRNKSCRITEKLKIVSNNDRLEILLMLLLREHCVDEMVRKLHTKKSAISYHLGILTKYNMICLKKRSSFAFYSLSQEGKRIIVILENF